MTVPPPPKPPLLREEPKTSWLPILLAMMLFGLVVSALSFLTLGALVGAVVLALLVLPGIILLHYLIWGWWLGKMIQAEAEEEARRNAASGK